MIQIVNDFFEKEELKKIQGYVKKGLPYIPRYFGKELVRNKETYYGMRFSLKHDKDLADILCRQAEKKFNIKIDVIDPDSGIDMRNNDTLKPHTDPAAANVLLMIDGPVAVSNGTVFYTKRKDEDIEDLDIHIGFQPNRAVFFPSDITHSANVSPVKNMRRYTCTLFLRQYTDQWGKKYYYDRDKKCLTIK